MRFSLPARSGRLLDSGGIITIICIMLLAELRRECVLLCVLVIIFAEGGKFEMLDTKSSISLREMVFLKRETAKMSACGGLQIR